MIISTTLKISIRKKFCTGVIRSEVGESCSYVQGLLQKRTSICDTGPLPLLLHLHLNMTNMRNTFIPFFLLIGLTAFLASCGAGSDSVSNESVQLQDSLLTIQAGRLMTMQSAIDINNKAMEMPFRGPEPTEDGEVVPPPANPLDGLPEENVLAFKETFQKVRAGLDGVSTEHQAIIQEVVDMQALIINARKELEGQAVTPETKSAFATLPEQITALKSKVDALEGKVIEIQKENLNLLMCETSLQSGASWLMANSPMI